MVLDPKDDTVTSQDARIETDRTIASEEQVGSADTLGAPSAANARLSIGSRIGRYTLVRKLGQGGMGIVWEAEDPDLERSVAIKLLHAGSGSEPASEGRARLLREAQAMARLSHPNVVSVFDVGEVDDEVFVAMELIDGETLTEWLEKEHGWRDIVAMFVRAGRGLAAAHAGGVVHRDFKPSNVIVGSDNHPRVLDFGLARESQHPRPDDSVRGFASPLTQAGAVMGTPLYMPPEQLRGDRSDERSDQYSFCASLWQGLYGEPPIVAETLEELAERAERGDIDEPTESKAPQRLQRILRRGLSVDAADRYESLETLLADLERDPGRRLRAVAAVVAVAAIAGGAIGYATLRPSATDACARDTSRIDSLWTEAHGDELIATLASLPQPAVEVVGELREALDAKREAWIEASRRACLDTEVRKTHGSDVLEQRIRCLERRFKRLEAGVKSAFTIDTVDAAIGALRYVEAIDPADCDEIHDSSVVFANPAEQREHDEIEQQIVAADAKRMLAQYAQAAEAVEPMVARARATGHPNLHCAALLTLSKSRRGNGELDAAIAAVDEAVDVASKSKDPALIAAVMVEKMASLSDAKRFTELFAMIAPTEAALLQADNPELRLGYYREVGVLLYTAGKYPEALKMAEDGVALARRLRDQNPRGADGNLDLADALSRLGTASLPTEGTEKARDHFKAALVIERQWYGEDSPRQISLLAQLALAETIQGNFDIALEYSDKAISVHKGNRGSDIELANLLLGAALTLGEAGRFDEARARSAEGMAIRERVVGRDSPQYAEGLTYLGELEVRAGAYDAAETAANAALKIFVAALGRDNPTLVSAYLLLGSVAQKRGDCRPAMKGLDEAVRIIKLTLGEKNLYMGLARSQRGACRHELGHPAALEDLTSAHAVLENFAPDNETEARVEFELGRALRKSDPARAEALISAAEKRIATDKRAGQLRKRIATWRASQPSK